MPRLKAAESDTGEAGGQGILARYARILDVVAASGSGLSMTDIAKDAGLSKATGHRLINALVDVGYLSMSRGGKTYQLGPSLIRLFHFAQAPATLSGLARPALQQIVRRFGETAFVARLNGRMVESVTVEIPELRTESHVQPGRLMPVNSAASAKAIFAFQPPSVLNKVLDGPLQRYTSRTIVDREQLRRELEKVRENGFAICSDELDPGVLSYACPIELPGLNVIYSVGVVGLSARLKAFPEADIVEMLRQTASAIGARLEGAVTAQGD